MSPSTYRNYPLVRTLDFIVLIALAVPILLPPNIEVGAIHELPLPQWKPITADCSAYLWVIQPHRRLAHNFGVAESPM
jgi:hypothetical protein